MNFIALNSFISGMFSLLAMTSIAYMGSLFTWQIINPQRDVVHPLVNPTSMQSDADTDQGELLSAYPLFGVPPVVKKAVKKRPLPKVNKVREVAPKVTLKLRGILATGDKSFAIIEVAREQGVYAEGDSISYLYIDKITRDYVVFSDDGIEHKVFVSDENVTIGGGTESAHTLKNASNTGQKQKVGNNVSDANNHTNNNLDQNALPTFVANLSVKEKQTLRGFKKTLRKNPLQVLGKVNAFPYRENGKLVGYRVTPGSERSLFKNVGLRSGDIILKANGKSLDEVNNFTQGMRLMEQLGNANTLDLLVRRGRVERRVYVSLDR